MPSADAWIVQDVVQAVDTIVSTSVGQQERLVVAHFNEAALVATRRTIHAITSCGCQQHERRGSDEASTQWIEMVECFAFCTIARRAIQRFKFGRRAD